ncbi:MAG: 4'-phosphopantetheinyl transferase superfamily protein [Lewinellaceae bacterium]|nr:4'-phosphopantetheinyl transferase superfamily protein [Saprospiraceae bacterium]MCB9339984.1 4'-phosphopantetheinyl transferase superfamily protein [Lewinellaceae bacterium]
MNDEGSSLILFMENKHPLDEKEWECSIHQLPALFHQNILRYKRWQDRQASLFGRLLLKKGLLALHQPPHFLHTIRLDAYKRPLMDGSIDFNISHTDGLVCCAIHQSSRLGIDVERVRPINLSDFKSVFTLAELDLISSHEDPATAFFDCWTRKEAVMKADGRGFHLDPSTFEVLGDQVRIDANRWFLKKVSLLPDYCCHVAQTVERPVRIQQLALSELLNVR